MSIEALRIASLLALAGWAAVSDLRVREIPDAAPLGLLVPPDGTAALRAKLGLEIALRTPAEIEERIEKAGFEAPCAVFQSTLYRAWCATRRA